MRIPAAGFLALALATPLPALLPALAPPAQAATGTTTIGTTTPAPDDTDFLFRLGMLEGHLMIGHELLAAGHPALALPHFGHPVRELYDDLADYIAAHHIAPFDTALIKLEAAVAAAPTAPATEAAFTQVIAQIHAARMVAPQALRDSIPAMIRICSDTVDAASGEYAEAVNRGRIDSPVEYHDSRGYLGYVAQTVGQLDAAAATPEDKSLLARFQAVLGRAQWIVAPLLPPSTPRASVSDYRKVAAEALAVAKQ
jgi:hypothetical protein